MEFPQGTSSFCEPSLCVCTCVNGAELPLSVVCPCLPKEMEKEQRVGKERRD